MRLDEPLADGEAETVARRRALVRLWVELRAMTRPVGDIADDAQRTRERRKQTEAADCAEQMENWYEERLHQANADAAAAPTAAAGRTRRADEPAPPSRS